MQMRQHLGCIAAAVSCLLVLEDMASVSVLCLSKDADCDILDISRPEYRYRSDFNDAADIMF